MFFEEKTHAKSLWRNVAAFSVSLALALCGLVGCSNDQSKNNGSESSTASSAQASEGAYEKDRVTTTYTESEKYVYPPFTGETTDASFHNEHAVSTEQLISLVEHNAELKSLLEKSIAKAAEVNPDRTTNPAQTLEEYYFFLDWAATALPWQIAPFVSEYSTLYDQIDQSLNYFYFLVDQPLEELEGRGYYNNTLQYYEPFRSWMILFTEKYGQYLNTTDSWSDELYQTALANPSFKLDGDLFEDPSNWKTFNQFFARYLADPSRRPVADAEDASVVVSPADAKPQGVWKIDGESMVISDDPITIKSGTLRSVDTLLGPSNFAGEFAGGTFTHMFLDVDDYHRYHFPVSGTIREVLTIPGDDAIGGRVIWSEKDQRYILEANDTSWQSIETRGLVIVETDGYGLVAIMPIGMSQVSSVCFEKEVQVGQRVEKGDMLGCFLFGGSDIVLIFQSDVEVEMVAEQVENGTYKELEACSRLAVLKKAE